MTAPSAETGTELARLLPRWHFREQHERTIAGSPADADAAFRALSLGQLPVSRALFAIRSLPSRITGGIGLPTSAKSPMLDLMLAAGFLLLADSPGREIVVGLVEPVTRLGTPGGAAAGGAGSGDPTAIASAFVSYDKPGAVKIAMTFLFAALDGGGTRVYTETRILATDAAARRRFSVYWLGIRFFSGLIRLEWLRAIDRRTASTAPH